MAKTTFYFSHDYNARTDAKIKKLIQIHGIQGYGVYWSIIEDLYNNANALPLDYESIAFELRLDVNIIKSIINDFSLFEIDENIFYSKSVQERLLLKDAKSDIARKNANERWEKEKQKTKNDANALQTECECNAIKENKINENKENKSNQSIYNYNIDPETQKKIDTFERICQKFLSDDLQNFIDHFKGFDIREKNIKEALQDYKDDKFVGDPKNIPYTYSNFKEWFKKYISDNRAKYKHKPKMRVVSISDEATRLDLHSAFKFYWQEEYTIEFIREKIMSGEFPIKQDSYCVDNLVRDHLIEIAND